MYGLKVGLNSQQTGKENMPVDGTGSRVNWRVSLFDSYSEPNIS
jgi:hypothetical protein